MIWLQALATFVAMAALDFVWAEYTRAVNRARSGQASILSGVLVGLNACIILSYADDHKMIAPAVLGAIVGTYLAVRRHGNENVKAEEARQL